MNITKIIPLILLLAGPAVSGDYQIKAIKPLPIEAYPARTAISGITIAADAYETDERSFTAFDVKDLNSRGYYPVYIVIQNSTPNFVSIRTQSIRLSTAWGQDLYTTSATTVVDDLFKAGFISKLPKMKSHDQSVSIKSGSPLVDFTSKELTNRQIEPGTISSGFVFFYTPKPNKAFFNGSKLLVPQVIEEGTRKTLGPFSIPLAATAPQQK